MRPIWDALSFVLSDRYASTSSQDGMIVASFFYLWLWVCLGKGKISNDKQCSQKYAQTRFLSFCIITIMKSNLPSIYQYSDFRRFLDEYQRAREMQNESFSRSAICKRLGLPNTRNFLNNVIAGRKVTPTYVERFVRVFEFDGEEARFFRVLVKYNQAENTEEKELYLEQLISLNKTPKKIVDKKAFMFFKEWYHSVIRSILDVFDFTEDYKSLARTLYPPISPKQAKNSIELLNSLGLIIKDSNGCWRPSDKSITTSPYIKDDLIFQYQMQCLELAKQAILYRYHHPQNITTNIISISKDGYTRIHKKIDKFRAEIRSLVHKDSNPSECVYQLSIQLFPAAKILKRNNAA